VVTAGADRHRFVDTVHVLGCISDVIVGASLPQLPLPIATPTPNRSISQQGTAEKIPQRNLGDVAQTFDRARGARLQRLLACFMMGTPAGDTATVEDSAGLVRAGDNVNHRSNLWNVQEHPRTRVILYRPVSKRANLALIDRGSAEFAECILQMSGHGIASLRKISMVPM